MDEIRNVDTFILIHISLYQCVSNLHYQHPLLYTQAAYYDQDGDQEYSWSKSKIKSRRQKTKYDISAELNYGSKRLKCKCKNKKQSYHKQRKNCYCGKYSDKSNEDHERYKLMAIQFPTTFYPLVPWFVNQDNDENDEEDKKDTCNKETETTKTPNTIETIESIKTTPTIETIKTIATTEMLTTTETKTTTKETTTTLTNSTTTPTATTKTESNMTVPVMLHDKKVFKIFDKKRKCLQNSCAKRKVGSRVGRYFYNDLILRPTLEDSLV